MTLDASLWNEFEWTLQYTEQSWQENRGCRMRLRRQQMRDRRSML
jgi:hypothetical protein